MNIVWLLITSLPDIIRLLRAIQKGIDEMEADRKAKDDIKSLHEAIKTKDPAKLDAIFNNSADSVPVSAAKS